MKHGLKIALLAGALSWSSLAQAGQMTLYTDVNFGGRAVTVQGALQDLSALGFNDRASSMVIDSGRWEVCVDAGYRGRCEFFERGQYPGLPRFNDNISSVREVGGFEHGRERGRGDEHQRRADQQWHADQEWRERNQDRGGRQWRSEPQASVLLYSEPDFGGDRLPLLRDQSNLDQFDFNDRAASIVIDEGEWEVCMHADFHGQCRIYGPGQYPRLGPLDGQVSSLRRVR
jgi:hypothetical protein